MTQWTVAPQAPLSMGILQARTLEWVATSSSSGSSQPRPPALQADFLPSEPPEKPKNTGVGSLALLQGIFLTKELNQGLLHCRWILYQLSYQGSPVMCVCVCVINLRIHIFGNCLQVLVDPGQKMEDILVIYCNFIYCLLFYILFILG